MLCESVEIFDAVREVIVIVTSKTERKTFTITVDSEMPLIHSLRMDSKTERLE